MKKKLAVTMVALFVLALSFAMAPKKASAIAPFAQKYHFSCAVCHINGLGGGSRLNPFGRAFQRNGFRLPGTNGTPADATDVAEGLSLPNPWPVPIMLEVNIGYKHVTNENISNSTDAFSAATQIHTGGAFKLYTPLADSLSWYTGLDNSAGSSATEFDNTFLVLNGVGSGFGVPSHFLNLVAGWSMNMFNPGAYFTNAGRLGVGYDGNSAGVLGEGAGFQVYGTPGFHLWYMIGVTNGAASASGSYIGGTALSTQGNNSMNYNWRLGEFYPTTIGTLELDYFGGTVAEPLSVPGEGTWTNRVTDNGVAIGLSNGTYEIGGLFNVLTEANPYANPNGGVLPTGVTDTSNGYQEFVLYADYKFAHLITQEGTYLQATYNQYSWTHSDSQDAFINGLNTAQYNCNSGLYGAPGHLGDSCFEGQKDNLALSATVMLASNVSLAVNYNFSNIAEEDLLSGNIEFAF